MLTDEQKSVHSEYRKYLRIVEGIKGNMLNTLVNATEKSLPTLIREHVRQDFNCIYDDKYSIEELLSFSAILKSDDESTVAITCEDDTEQTFDRGDIALIRLALDF